MTVAAGGTGWPYAIGTMKRVRHQSMSGSVTVGLMATSDVTIRTTMS